MKNNFCWMNIYRYNFKFENCYINTIIISLSFFRILLIALAFSYLHISFIGKKKYKKVIMIYLENKIGK